MLKELFGKILKCKNKLNKKKEENKEQGKKETKLEKEKNGRESSDREYRKHWGREGDIPPLLKLFYPT